MIVYENNEMSAPSFDGKDVAKGNCLGPSGQSEEQRAYSLRLSIHTYFQLGNIRSLQLEGEYD